MAERGILFSAPMVRAILAGTKTQTRRVVKLPRSIRIDGKWMAETRYAGTPQMRHEVTDWDDDTARVRGLVCPFGQPGDRLWVREAWRTTFAWDRLPPRDLPGSVDLHYEADGRPNAHFSFGKLRPGMFMPRGASRITLEVTGVRVERLQDISEADAIAEGVHRFPGCRQDDDAAAFNRIGPVDNDSFPIARYAVLWESINGAGSWDANPWVWVVEFRRVASKSSEP